MSDPVPPPKPQAVRRRLHRTRKVHAAAWGWVLALGAMLCAIVAVLAISETRIALPDELTTRIAARINAANPDYDLSIGQILIGLDRQAIPRLWVTGAHIDTKSGQRLAQFAEGGVAFDTAQALKGRIAPRILRIRGAIITLRRDASGAFDLALGGTGQRIEGGLGAVLLALDAALGTAPLDRVDRVELSGSTITVEDARSARIWQLSDATATLVRGPGGLTLNVGADIFNGTDSIGALQASAVARRGGGGASATLRLVNIRARDIALQSPVLSFLGVLKAPLSGALRVAVDGTGQLTELAGTLEIGAGTLAPRAGAAPVPFDRAKAYFTYDPGRARLDFSQIEIAGGLGRGLASGHAYLVDPGVGAVPRALLGQMTFQQVALDAPELFDAPVALTQGQLDFRVRLDPFSVEIGQIAVPDMGGAPGRDVFLSGRAAPQRDGWHVAVDGRADALSVDALMRLWPRPVAPKARKWMIENIATADATNVNAALRFAPGDAKPRLNLTFGFRDADVRVMRDVPLVRGASGLGSIMDDRLVIEVTGGALPMGARGALALAGTTFVIPDGRIKPSPAQIRVAAAGPLPALLAVLDGPRLQLLTKDGRDADLATGHVSGTAAIDLILQKDNRREDITITAEAGVTDLASASIVPGRDLQSDRVAVSLTDTTLSARGALTLDDVPFDGEWQQQLGGPRRGRGSVSGTAILGAAQLAAFGVKLPDGLVTGQGTAQLDLALVPGQPVALKVQSDLRGLGIDIAGVNWSKPAGTVGDLQLEVTLAETPRIDRLTLAAPGLSAEGRVTLGPGPVFRALSLDRVRLGDWLDAAVTLTARGLGQPPAIRVAGGEIDIRRVRLGQGGGGGTSAARGPVSLRLDRLRVTDTVALEAFEMDLAAGRAVSGEFRGRVNGGVPVAGTLAGTGSGTAIRIRSSDAGAVLRDAGLFRNVAGGALDLTLRPGGGRGIYEGRIDVTETALRNAPAMADLLSAISVVGLLEQLQGQGIPFDQVSADFRLTPGRITLYRSSATGNSLGLSMDGTYDPQARTMDMQGVVSPVYLLNRVGEFLTRQGEGLIGVNFTLSGPVSDPSVGVNPLSLLTPGMFRDIFRRPPPVRAN